MRFHDKVRYKTKIARTFLLTFYDFSFNPCRRVTQICHISYCMIRNPCRYFHYRADNFKDCFYYCVRYFVTCVRYLVTSYTWLANSLFLWHQQNNYCRTHWSDCSGSPTCWINLTSVINQIKVEAAVKGQIPIRIW